MFRVVSARSKAGGSLGDGLASERPKQDEARPASRASAIPRLGDAFPGGDS
jgi:hypothetical protein